MQESGYGYNCAAGETFDSVARAVYGDESYAACLLCMNPEYSTVMTFAGGEVLRLPVVETTGDEASVQPETAPWRE